MGQVSLLSAMAAVGATTAPVDARPAPGLFQPQMVMPIQGRGDGRQQSIRPLREVVGELQSRYGGELISARQGRRTPDLSDPVANAGRPGRAISAWTRPVRGIERACRCWLLKTIESA